MGKENPVVNGHQKDEKSESIAKASTSKLMCSYSSDDECRPKTIQAKVFPSLSDKVLEKWGLRRKPGGPLDW